MSGIDSKVGGKLGLLFTCRRQSSEWSSGGDRMKMFVHWMFAVVTVLVKPPISCQIASASLEGSGLY
jgi:hypothetical protein